jgi:pimeloyl-ACP methyl ester carboxylesterase
MKRKDLLGGTRLALDAVKGVTALVEAVHMNVLERAIGTPAIKPVSVVTRLVYRAIGLVQSASGAGLDAALARATPRLAQHDWKGRGPVLAALNGVLGDHLEVSGNPLAIEMHLSPAGATGRRVLILVHGLCMSGAQWRHDETDLGALLAEERDLTALYLDYNSGRHIADNGRDFAALLAEVSARPEVEEIIVLAHSMGGLVLRSALLQAAAPVGKLSTVVFLGTPHCGAPLERAGNWVNTIADLNAYSAPFSSLAKLRSAGITDLRHGSIVQEDAGADRFARSRPGPLTALPEGVTFYAVAGMLGNSGTDGLVPLDSALGRGDRGTLQFRETAVLEQTGHMALLSSSAVADLLRRWL